MNSIGQLKIDEKFLSTLAWLSILFGGLWVRINGVSEYYLNSDELQFLIIAKGETLAEVWRRGLTELHPPLAHFIRHYLLMISPDVFHQRLFGIAASMVSILGMYRLGYQLRGKFLGLFCAACMAFFPVAVSTSVTIRNYAFFMAFLSWAVCYFVCYQKQEKRRDLVIFSVLLFLASATHFTGFLVAAALGISQGLRLLLAKRWQSFALLSVSFLPLLLLGIFFYCHYLAPGTAGPMWHRMAIELGYAPHDFSGRLLTTLQSLFLYFAPIWLLPLVQLNSTFNIFILLFISLLIFSAYLSGLVRVYKENSALFTLILTIWGVALLAALTDYYPFSIGRHNYYLLPFFALPLGYEAQYFIQSCSAWRFSRYLGIALIVITVCLFERNKLYLQYLGEFSVTNNNFNAGQLFLKQNLQPDDLIILQSSTYMYLLYDKDAGKSSYKGFAEFTYRQNRVLAPFDPPFKLHYSEQPFHDNLKLQVNAPTAQPERNVWFVMYSWKNGAIWRLMMCNAIKPQIQNYFSRDGVLIFSIQVKELAHLLEEKAAWKACYAGYKPLTTPEMLKAYPSVHDKKMNGVKNHDF